MPCSNIVNTSCSIADLGNLGAQEERKQQALPCSCFALLQGGAKVRKGDVRYALQAVRHVRAMKACPRPSSNATAVCGLLAPATPVDGLPWRDCQLL